MPENTLLNLSGKGAMPCSVRAAAKETLNWPLKEAPQISRSGFDSLEAVDCNSLPLKSTHTKQSYS